MAGSSDDIGRISRSGEDSFAAKIGACSACGARARRAGARYCSTCGRALGEEYFPTDALRASYRFERPRAAREPKSLGGKVRARARGARAPFRRGLMIRRSGSGVSATALAFVTYALVPYLGILFCPGAILFGGFGLLRLRGAAHAGARRDAALSVALGLLIFCAQVFLWWILYKIPEWSRNAPF
jgi:hypothetical protein